MSATAVAILLGALVVLLIRTRWLRFSGALVCVVLGVVLANGPMGPATASVLDSFGSWAFDSIRSV
jgi:hypothetical protein